MAEATNASAERATPVQRLGTLGVLWALIPLLLLGVLLAVVFMTGAGLGPRMAPPIEELTIDRITLPSRDAIVVEITNGGVDEVTVAQVQVDDAYWAFTISPDSTIPRLGQATITIPYPWVQDETHLVKLVSANGVTFEGEVAIATQTPPADMTTFWRYALLGIYVGLIPVGLGLLWYPFLRRLGRQGMHIVLSLTVGLLLFLLFDTFAEALDLVGRAAGVYGGAPLIFLIALLTCLALMAIGARSSGTSSSKLGLAYRIALGIGLHNLGEGLAIGAAFVAGEAALGAFLVIGFTLHNITEGIGIAAPLVRERPAFRHFVALAILGGLPAVAGVWIGGFIFSNLLAAVFLALGAGAIAQVIIDVGRLLVQQSKTDGRPLLSPATFGGLVAGVVIMYATALLVTA